MILSLNYFIKKAIRYERYETSSVENQLNGTSNGTGFYDQMKHKIAFWQQTHQMGLVQTGIQSTPCPLLNILLDL